MSERGTWLSGAIAFALLIVLTLSLAPGGIQEDLTERATATLARAGYDFALVEVDGRDVRLSGTAPDDVTAAEAIAEVRELWGVRSANDALETVALKVPEPTAEPSSQAAASQDPIASASAGTSMPLSARERGAQRRISPELCQRLMDGLMASDAIHFDAASAALQRRSYELLAHAATAAVHCPHARLIVGGHVDASGDPAADRRLSEQRALAVAQHLAANGVSAHRLEVVGYGSERPVANNASERERAMNRRIEITVE